MATLEKPPPRPLAFHASRGPAAGHLASSPDSCATSSRLGPRHCGHSGELLAAAVSAADMTSVRTRAAAGGVGNLGILRPPCRAPSAGNGMVHPPASAAAPRSRTLAIPSRNTRTRMPHLATARLMLRPWQTGDEEALVRYADNPNVGAPPARSVSAAVHACCRAGVGRLQPHCAGAAARLRDHARPRGDRRD